MSELESRYRTLFLAYPADHRNQYEEEMISTLLDVACDDQRRPTLREGSAIVAAGLNCRFQNSAEAKRGVHLAAIAALALTVAVAAMSLTAATASLLIVNLTGSPITTELVPIAAWVGVVVVALFGSSSRATYRAVPATVTTLVMAVGGSSLMGLRRSALAPAAIVLVLSACGGPTRRSIRTGAIGVGAIVGALQGIRLVSYVAAQIDLNGPWVAEARWDVASDTLSSGRSFLFVVFVALAAAAGIWRLRYGVALGLFALPVALITIFVRYPRSTSSSAAAVTIVAIAIAACGVAALTSWRTRVATN